MPPKKDSAAPMETDKPSFLNLDNNTGSRAQTSMFRANDNRRMTSSQHDLARDMRITEESTRAEHDLKVGVPVSQFVNTFRKIVDVKMHESDEEVKKFLAALRVICDRIAKAERQVFMLEEQRSTRTQSVPFLMLQLKGSQDLINQFIDSPQRIGGFYSYLVTTGDLLFPKQSGFRMKLYSCDGVEELKARVWNVASEVVIKDLISANVESLRGLFSALSPNWLNQKPGENASAEEMRRWIDETFDMAMKSQEAGLEYIQSVEGMEDWSLDTTIEYCAKWGDKARLCHVLGMDHLRPSHVVTVGSNGVLRCLETRFNVEEDRHLVEKVALPGWASHWKVYTGGRSWSSSSGGFAGDAAYKRPAPSRGNYHGFAPKRGSYRGRGGQRGRF